MTEGSERIAAQYGRADLTGRILEALRRSGVETDALTVDALAPIDQFHTGGAAATQSLIVIAEPRAEWHVLDVGSGIGGPARTLATRFGCRVTGIDLTPEFCATAEHLTALVGLADRVDFHHGNALDMPFADASFNLVWSQNAVMNIADRAGLYAEMRRVLRPGGRLATSDVVAGPNAPPHFPVPWADEPSISVLLTADETRRAIEDAGFRCVVWQDLTAAAIGPAKARAEAATTAAPTGLHVIVGPSWPEKSRNMARNLAEGRIGQFQAVLERDR